MATPNQEIETARTLGELKSEVASNRKDTEKLWDGMKKQNESIQQLERSIDQLRGVVERLAEGLNNQVTDRSQFQREIKADIARLDGEIKQEIELLKEDLQARRAVTGFISTLVKLWPVITAVGAAVVYYGYVVITGEQPPTGKP
jgi:chromosome segregation ATPase